MANEKEADWMKDIPSETICTYYYYIFVVTTVFVALILFWELSTIARSPKANVWGLIRVLPTLVLAVVNTLFIYIVCSRALLK